MRLAWPSSLPLSLVAAATTWLTATAWAGFGDRPATFLPAILLGCLLVAVAGALLRAARLPVVLVAAGQLALVALWLNHRLASADSIGGWLPTTGSIRSALDALDASFAAARVYAAPVPESVTAFPPMLVLTGSLAAVAVDLLACGLRRVPLAGLPLLAMYTAPVSILGGQVAWWKFAAAGLSFLLLLATDEATRLTRWGRELGDEGRQHAAGRSVWPAARKIGLTTTGIAVVVPLLVPTLSEGVFAGHGNGPGSGAGDGVQITNPIVDLKKDLVQGDDRPLMIVRTSDPDPSYIRIAVLDSFDGERWLPSRRDLPVANRAEGEVPSPPGLASGVKTTPHDYLFSIGGSFQSQWLPAPYPVSSIEVPGDWRYDASTMDFVSFVQSVTAAGLSYPVTGLTVQPTAEQLASAGSAPTALSRRFTEIDDSVPSWVGELATRVTDAGLSKYDKAVLLQSWFRDPHPDEEADPSFRYDLARSPGGSAIDDLTEFLQGSRTGYCEQFAAAMALMARELGIPARVAVGFLGPERNPDEPDLWVYSQHDLHAWPELYFEGVGWTRFEPTPSGAAGRSGAVAPPYTRVRQTQEPSATANPSPTAPTASSSTTARPSPRLPDEGRLPSTQGQDPGSRWWLALLVVLPLLALTVSIPRVARVVSRRRRWAAARTPGALAEAAWAELRDTMTDLQLPWQGRHLTVRQRADSIRPRLCRHPGPGEEHLARVVRNNPAAEAALDRITRLVERSRYAPSAPEPEAVRADVALVVEALRIGSDKSALRRADWLPASLLARRQRREPRPVEQVAALSEPVP